MKSAMVIAHLKQFGQPAKAEILKRFFKTGRGEYAEGDQFWGITVPTIRKVSLQYKTLPFVEIETLIQHPIHEVRLCGLLILVSQAKNNQQAAASLYLKNTHFINNWDLVDLTAAQIVGPIIHPNNVTLLIKLARSSLLWERRIAILTTFHFIKLGNPQPTFTIATELLTDSHDLIHKAVGWMLREVGKRCSIKMEYMFLDQHATIMPRTMLRYAIERFDEPIRLHYLSYVKRSFH